MVRAVAGLAAVVAAVFALYWPSLQGPFMFDDWVNLGVLGAHQDLPIAKQILVFITREGASFIDRPLSRLSFYLNDTAWPSDPASFRLTNISIHALNSVLVWWLCLRLLTLYQPAMALRTKLLLVSLIALIWAIHPIQVNTVAYVIQRMTLLSGTFVLGGLITYTYGREMIQAHKAKGLLVMSLALIVFLPLAFLSKQNGILLLLFIAVTEYTLFERLPGRTWANRWSIPFLLAPTLLVLLALTLKADDKVFSWYDAMPFTPVERLMTESRILFDYIGGMLLPRARTSSLFHDDYLVSHSLLDPPSTLIAILALLLVVAVSLVKRKQWPLLAFSCGWFLAGHLLESSIIGLELYYEHRNYIPSLGIIFGIVTGAWTLLHNKPATTTLLASGMVALLAFITWMNTSAWESRETLVTNWYQENPASLRTANLMAGMLNDKGDYESARAVLLKAENDWPRNPEPPLLLLLLDCVNKQVDSDSVGQAIASIPTNYTHSNIAANIIEKLHAPIMAGQCPPLSLDDLDRLLEHMLKNPKIQAKDKSRKWRSLGYNLFFWKARLAAEQRDLSKAMHYADLANKITPNPDLMTLQAAWLASAGLDREALSVARRALALSRQDALFDYLNPYEDNLKNLVSTLEQKTRDHP